MREIVRRIRMKAKLNDGTELKKKKCEKYAREKMSEEN